MTKRKTKDALKAIFDFSNKMSKEQAKIRNKSKEIRQMFNKYVSALSGDNKEREMIEEEISEEELDSIPCSTTKH